MVLVLNTAIVRVVVVTTRRGNASLALTNFGVNVVPIGVVGHRDLLIELLQIASELAWRGLHINQHIIDLHKYVVIKLVALHLAELKARRRLQRVHLLFFVANYWRQLARASFFCLGHGAIVLTPLVLHLCGRLFVFSIDLVEKNVRDALL